MKVMSDTPPFALRHWLQDRFLRGLIWLLLRLPYRWRVPLCGWVLSRLISPLAGYDRRIRENLALVLPGLPGPMQAIRCETLPSTSPAHAAMRFDQPMAAG